MQNVPRNYIQFELRTRWPFLDEPDHPPYFDPECPCVPRTDPLALRLLAAIHAPATPFNWRGTPMLIERANLTTAGWGVLIQIWMMWAEIPDDVLRMDARRQRPARPLPIPE